MKITIIGGSQGTGAQLASVAMAADHDVTVVSRSGTGPAGATIVAGDATDVDVVREAITGADAVVVTVGGAKGVEHQRTKVTEAAIAAMKDAGVRRLVVQSSLGAGDSGSQMPALLRVLMKAVLAKPLADHDRQEATVFASGLDWTVVRPTGLKDKPATGTWRALEVSDEGTLSGSIPRADLAACMLDVLGDDATIGTVLGVSS
ncbi:NAD(P)-dependent oxidoreductase [uncultured Corynebacterium sp.]|uniref:NAD(P)-dependent oxidoreductase n=1 Tax=uncultured Corynebacterium sp. TaxID=159447 RepID=UPI0025E19DA1|nr:NAD(P)-binding oxidoreductase [uncultured Corynebacterium sp.]